jgi:nucleoside-diphosphate-sugar epimerase
MNILITGALGFLGRHLVEYLNHTEHRVTLVDYTATNLKGHLVHGMDITNEHAKLHQLMQAQDLVIHAANRARIEPSWRNYQQYYDNNITGSQTVFRTAQAMSVKRFVYVSSSSVYGQTSGGPSKEEDPLLPTNPYGVSKMAAEHALRVQAQAGDTELIIVRPFCMYGEFMDRGPDGLVVARFLQDWVQGQSLKLDGGGSQTRDFIHASDAVKGLMAICEQGSAGATYNLGSGDTVSIKELADIVSSNQIETPQRLGHVDCTWADISKLQNLGFEPRVDVREWLTRAVADIKIKNHNNIKETI